MAHPKGSFSPVPYPVVRRVTDGIVAFDADLRFTYVNPRAEAIFGKTYAELQGQPARNVFPDEEGARLGEVLRSALRDRTPRTLEYDSAILHKRFIVRVYPDADGLSVYLLDAMHMDIPTLERPSERQDATRWLQALADNMPEAVYVKDREGRYQFVNEATARLFGMGRAEVVGKRDTDLFDPERAAASRTIDEAILRTLRPHKEETVRYINGKQRVFLDARTVYRDESGGVAGTMGISHDITERMEREEELLKLTGEYKAILHNTEDVVFLLDVHNKGDEPTFTFRWISPSHESRTGMAPTDIAGKSPREVLGEAAGAAVERNYRQCVWARAPIDYEEEPDLPGGTRTWHTKLAPVVVDGEVQRIVGVARDLTERVARERELQQKNDRLNEFASVVAHDLRNPLHIALRSIAQAEQNGSSKHLDTAQRALQRMDAIIVDTLTLAREGQTVASLAPVDVSELAHESWEFVHIPNGTLQVEEGIVVRGDANRLRHIFENLFRNAREHAGPVVSVRVGRAGPDAFFVADDGPGIPPQRRGLIFEPGHTSTPRGTGFGLAIVRGVAQAHGWRVEVTDAMPSASDASDDAEASSGANGEAGPGARFLFTNVDVFPPGEGRTEEAASGQ